MDALTQVFVLSSLIRGSEEDWLVVWWRNEGDHAGLWLLSLARHLSIPSQHLLPSHLVSIRVFDVEPAYH